MRAVFPSDHQLFPFLSLAVLLFSDVTNVKIIGFEIASESSQLGALIPQRQTQTYRELHEDFFYFLFSGAP